LSPAVYHDLKEPLRGTLVALQELDRQLEGSSEDARAVDAVEHQRALLEDLRDLAEARDREEVDREPVDLQAAVDDVLVPLEEERERADARVEVGGLPAIRADPEQVHVLLTNLLSNAVKFGGEGVTVQVRVHEEPRRWHLVVEDDGPGIAEAHQETVLEVF